jgi:hypothetical protein
MSLSVRIGLALGLFFFDAIFFFFPIGSTLIAYIIIFRPKWVEEFVSLLYKGEYL